MGSRTQAVQEIPPGPTKALQSPRPLEGPADKVEALLGVMRTLHAVESFPRAATIVKDPYQLKDLSISLCPKMENTR